MILIYNLGVGEKLMDYMLNIVVEGLRILKIDSKLTICCGAQCRRVLHL